MTGWAGPVRASRAARRCLGERGDPLHDLLRRSGRWCRACTAPRGRAQRAVLALRVALVAQRLLGEHRRRIGAQLGRAPARALGGARRSGRSSAPRRARRPCRCRAPRRPSRRRRSARAAWPRAPRARPGRRPPARPPRRPRGCGSPRSRRARRAAPRPRSPRALPSSIARRAGEVRRLGGRRGEPEQRHAAVHGAAVEVGEAQSLARGRGRRSTCPHRRDRRSRSASELADQPARLLRSSTKPG